MKLNTEATHRTSITLGLALGAALLVAGCSERSADQYLQTGKGRLEKGDARGAAIEFKNALQRDASSSEARFLFATSLLKMGDAAGAEVELEKVEKAGFDSDRVAPLLARAMAQQGKAAQAIAKYRDVKLGNPQANAALQVVLGQAYLVTRRLDEAKAAGKLALEAAPAMPEARQLQARILAVGGDLPGAVAQTKRLIDETPREASNWMMLGDFQLASGDPKAARQSYETAIKHSTGDTKPYFSLMPILLLTPDLPAAATTLAELEKIDGKHPLTQYFKAWLKMEQGDLKSAQELALGVLKVLPENPDVLYLAGTVESRRNSLERAVDYLGKAVTLAPDQWRPRLLLASTQLRRGEAARALTTLQPLLKLDVPPAEALVQAAAASTRLGEPPEKAARLLARAVEVEPGHVQARVGLARIKIDRGDAAAGLRELRDVAASTPELSPNVALVETLVARRNYDEAIAALKALEAKPGGKIIADMQRGRIELARANVNEARQAFDSVLKTNSNYIPAISALAALDIGNRDVEKAQARFQAVLDKEPGNAAARAALLRLNMDRGAPSEELIAMAQTAVKAAPDSRELRVDLVRLLLAKADAKPAAQAAQEAINLLGDDPELLALLGQAQLASNDTNLSVTTLTKLVSLRPALPQPYLLLAAAQKKRGDFAQAVQALKRGIDVAPDYPLLYQTLVGLQMGNGQYAQALQTAKQWQARDKAGWIGYSLEGDIHLRQERYDQAAEAYRTGMGRNPAPVLAIRLHQVLRLAGKKDAVAALEAKRLADNPKDLPFVNYLAETAMNEKQFPLAEARFRKALEIEPSNPAILNNLAWVLGKQDKNAAALEVANKAVKLAPKQPTFLDTRAELQAKMGLLDDAVTTQRQAVALDPRAELHRLHLAAYLIKAGKKSDAKEELARLEQGGSGGPDLQAEVKRLQNSL